MAVQPLLQDTVPSSQQCRNAQLRPAYARKCSGGMGNKCNKINGGLGQVLALYSVWHALTAYLELAALARRDLRRVQCHVSHACGAVCCRKHAHLSGSPVTSSLKLRGGALRSCRDGEAWAT